MPIDTHPIVEARGLTKVYGTRMVVDGVSFHVAQGEVFALIGPNGSGKSTTIRMLCGILKPTSGSARVLDFDIATSSERIKQHIGYMSQRFSLYEDLTVRRNLEFYAGIYGVPKAVARARMDELFAMAGLTGREHQRVGQLSGGWKQRLALTCAIVHRPRLLFLDEPTAGVDPISRRRFFSMLLPLIRAGTTVLLTTHLLEEAEYADRVGMLENGLLRALASPGELRRTGLRGRLLNLSCDHPIDAAEILRDTPGVREVVLYGHQVHVLIDPLQQSPETLASRLIADHITVGELQDIEPSLEDVFISLSSGLAISDDGHRAEIDAKYLRTIPLFADLPENLLSVLANSCQVEQYVGGSVVVQQGRKGEKLYVIASGQLDVLQRQATGEEVHLRVLDTGEFFGELALLNDVPRTATVRARTPCLLLTLDRQQVQQLLETNPSVRLMLEATATARGGSLDGSVEAG